MNEYKKELEQIFDEFIASVGPLDETEQDDYELAFLLFKESLFSSREGKKRKRPSEDLFPCEDIDLELAKDVAVIEKQVKEKLDHVASLKKRVNTEQYFEAIKEKIHVRALKVQEGIESTRNTNIDQVETDIKNEEKLIQTIDQSCENYIKVHEKLSDVNTETTEALNRARRLRHVADMLHKMKGQEVDLEEEEEKEKKKELPSFPYSM